MIPYVRRCKILEFINTKDIVLLGEIAKVAKVSMATVRRDLKILEEEGHIEILAGGAAKKLVNMVEKTLVEKMTTHEDEKCQIGSYSATLIRDGEFIFLGPGTTEKSMIKYIIMIKDLFLQIFKVQ